MFNLLIGIVLVILVAVLGVLVWYIFLRGGDNRAEQPGCQTFATTGKSVCGRFLTYWQEHGGLGQQGYPLSGEFREVSPIDSKTYTVQYFERAVFEYHPEKTPPYDVLLALLGTIRYRETYPAPPPPVAKLPDALHPAGGALFPQTGKVVRGAFLDYWLGHGGPMQYGYPITGPLVERSEVDGQEYLVQYFERAELELHPANQPPYTVLPALLGRLEFQRKYPGGDPALSSPVPGAASPTPSPRR